MATPGRNRPIDSSLLCLPSGKIKGHCPSLVISPQKNLWHCLGACQTGGSVIDWVMRAEGVSFRHAVELLR